ncbi:hypothetical protein TNIN_472371 [Trichonephila inaurata madagascariensis]|uniref:Uncharacterized protein n=1 Tax=Trichonephila inaurata madagascariensis TaxID=2747483 RepID=A0A8X6XTE0_9ARAC|nr:hypothetical protein TNIN_472371 [Trichonephila inaurata madagascariensis]
MEFHVMGVLKRENTREAHIFGKRRYSLLFFFTRAIGVETKLLFMSYVRLEVERKSIVWSFDLSTLLEAEFTFWGILLPFCQISFGFSQTSRLEFAHYVNQIC